MPFTSTTIKKLRELNLPQTTFDKILEIFEDAQLSKPRKKGDAADRKERGTRLPDDWILPAEWRQWSVELGMRPHEADREGRNFKSYWLNCVGAKGIKLKWKLTWETWCRRTLERQGRPMNEPGAPTPAPADGPDSFNDATWAAISKRWKSSGQWSPEWGPNPSRMDCRMPEKYL